MIPCQNRGLPMTLLSGNWREPRMEGTAGVSLPSLSPSCQIPKLDRAGKNRTKTQTDLSSESQVSSLLWQKKEKGRRGLISRIHDLKPRTNSRSKTLKMMHKKKSCLLHYQHFCTGLLPFARPPESPGWSLSPPCPPSSSPHVCHDAHTLPICETIPAAFASMWKPGRWPHLSGVAAFLLCEGRVLPAPGSRERGSGWQMMWLYFCQKIFLFLPEIIL